MFLPPLHCSIKFIISIFLFIEGIGEDYLKEFAEKYPEAYKIYKIISNSPLYLSCFTQTDSPTQDEACQDLCPLSQSICSSDVCTCVRDCELKEPIYHYTIH